MVKYLEDLKELLSAGMISEADFAKFTMRKVSEAKGDVRYVSSYS